jgi:protein O-GlcNAc transferase
VMGQLPMDKYMNLSAIADFALDSYPISGGVTTFHSLAMGLPVLTIRPAEPIALYAYSANTLETVGMPECIADSPEALVNLASQWIKQPTLIERARQKSLPALLASPYMQHAERTRELEAAYLDMWHAQTMMA